MTTTNKNVVNAELNIVKPMSLVGFGTILKGWRGSKGIDYIITGIDTVNKKVYTIKHNAINEDGTVHKAVKRHRRVFEYTLTPSGKIGIIKGITTVLGQKASIDPVVLDKFNKSVNSQVTVTGFNTVQLYTQPLVDRRKSSIYG